MESLSNRVRFYAWDVTRPVDVMMPRVDRSTAKTGNNEIWRVGDKTQLTVINMHNLDKKCSSVIHFSELTCITFFLN